MNSLPLEHVKALASRIDRTRARLVCTDTEGTSHIEDFSGDTAILEAIFAMRAAHENRAAWKEGSVIVWEKGNTAKVLVDFNSSEGLGVLV